MATGANPVAAAIAGTRARAIRIAVYVASGSIAAVTGALLAGYVGQAFLGLGTTYVLPSVIVAVIGGVSLAGGRGRLHRGRDRRRAVHRTHQSPDRAADR